MREVDGLVGGRVVGRLEGKVGVLKKQKMVVKVVRKKKLNQNEPRKKNSKLPKKKERF
jgi:hypothetical protein